MPRSMEFGGCALIFPKVGYLLYNKYFSMIFATFLENFGQYWGILGPFWGHILGASWEMVTNFRHIYTRGSWSHERRFKIGLC
jgi:hypothetical protein